IQEDHARQRAPRAAQPDVRHAGLRGQLAMVEYEQALLAGLLSPLGGEIADDVRGAVDLAIVEHGQAVAKNEIDVALDERSFEVLPCRCARAAAFVLRWRAVRAARVQRVL